VAEPFSVTRLRWRVRIGQRIQTADPTASIVEQFLGAREVWADVQPVGALTFWGSVQVDTPVTHRIIIRWVGYIDNTWAVVRETKPASLAPLPQTAQGFETPRVEIFRVRRVIEIDGRKRFTGLDCELERVL